MSRRERILLSLLTILLVIMVLAVVINQHWHRHHDDTIADNRQVMILHNDALLAQSKLLPLAGYLIQKPNKNLYLKVSDQYITTLYPLVKKDLMQKSENVTELRCLEILPLRDSHNLGAHISVFKGKKDVTTRTSSRGLSAGSSILASSLDPADKPRDDAKGEKPLNLMAVRQNRVGGEQLQKDFVLTKQPYHFFINNYINAIIFKKYNGTLVKETWYELSVSSPELAARFDHITNPDIFHISIAVAKTRVDNGQCYIPPWQVRLWQWL